jgi:WD40 repeat protein
MESRWADTCLHRPNNNALVRWRRPKGRVSAEQQLLAQLVNQHGDVLQTIVAESNDFGINVLAWSPDGEILAIGNGNTLQLWRAGQGIFFTEQELGDQIMALAWRPDGQMFATAGFNVSVHLWERDGTFIEVLKAAGVHLLETMALAWTDDGQRLAVGSQSKPYTVYVRTTGHSFLRDIGRAPETIVAMTWDKRGNRLFVASEDGTVQQLTASGTREQHFRRIPSFVSQLTGWVTPIAWRPDGQQVAVVGLNCSVLVIDCDGHLVRTYEIQHAEDVILAWSPDGQMLVCYDHDTLLIWDDRGVLRGKVFGVVAEQIAWGSDSKVVAVRSKERAWRWQLDTIEQPIIEDATSPEHAALWETMLETPLIDSNRDARTVLSPDGRTELRISDNGALYLYGVIN